MSTTWDTWDTCGEAGWNWGVPTASKTFSHRQTSPMRREYQSMELSAALTQSMHHITTTKLSALSRQGQQYETVKAKILQAVASESNIRKKIAILLNAFERHNIPIPISVSIANIEQFLKQSGHDPSISPNLLLEWQNSLEKALDIPSHKYEHASLFGRLVMEWLGKTAESPAASSGSDTSEPFEHVGRKEMHDQRKEWETIVFAKSPHTNMATVDSYLDKIFGSTSQAKKMVRSPLENMQESLASFQLGQLDIDSLRICIAGVLKTDLLSDAKRKTLAEFSGNSTILWEMVDVLNMEIDSLDSWSWGDGAVPVVVRRALNGKYRVYMDEDIPQALLLHFIGMKWGVHLRKVFLAFFNSGAWVQSSRQSLDRQARQRRQEFLGREYAQKQAKQTVRNERRDRYQREYFLLQLPTSFESTLDNYEHGADDTYGDSKSAMAMKQSLLHLMSTEALMNTRLYGSFTILQSDFRWFGPSMPHETIIAVLSFLGVAEQWLNFFEKFLKAPIKFTAMDGPGAQAQIRQCGVPIQHRLGDALSEAVLFCLDFAVNKATESNLYRLHDDIWFWGEQRATIKAWRVIQDFTGVMGLTLNEGKTGAVELSGSPVSAREFGPSDALPSGPITWGFLKMGSSGQWIVDDAQVVKHTKELQLQLEACRSIFAWVQAWNVYAGRFISNNIGEPANCLGRPHVDNAIRILEKIQAELFPVESLQGNSPIEHLRAKLNARFGLQDVPDGFFLFPTELGGLDLINPLIPLFGVYHESLENPRDLIDRALEEDELEYERMKKAFTNGTSQSANHQGTGDQGDFMTLEEYTQYREETSLPLSTAYQALMNAPSQSRVEHTPDVKNARRSLSRDSTSRSESYDDWVMELYGPEIIRRFGGLAMGEKRLLPIGLAKTLRSQKVRWQG